MILINNQIKWYDHSLVIIPFISRNVYAIYFSPFTYFFLSLINPLPHRIKINKYNKKVKQKNIKNPLAAAISVPPAVNLS